MNNLVRSLFVILSVVSFGTSSYSGVTASDSPAMFLFRACREAGTDVRDAIEPLLRAGWTCVTSAASLRRVVTERNHMRVRAKLSRSSYPERWDDATVRRSYPSTMARSMDELVAHVNRNTEVEIQSSPSRIEFVLSAPSGNALTAVFYWASSLICAIVVKSSEESVLRDKHHSEFPPARQEGASGGRFFKIDDHQVAIVILSSHAQQRDERFPVAFDMSVWMRFEKGPGRK